MNPIRAVTRGVSILCWKRSPKRCASVLALTLTLTSGAALAMSAPASAKSVQMSHHQANRQIVPYAPESFQNTVTGQGLRAEGNAHVWTMFVPNPVY